jgi:hypothetical protein
MSIIRVYGRIVFFALLFLEFPVSTHPADFFRMSKTFRSKQTHLLQETVDHWRADIFRWITETRAAVRSEVSGLYTRAARLEASVAEVTSSAHGLAMASRQDGARRAMITAASETSKLRSAFRTQALALLTAADDSMAGIKRIEELYHRFVQISSEHRSRANQAALTELQAARAEALRAEEQETKLSKRVAAQKAEIEELSCRVERQQVQLGRFNEATISGLIAATRVSSSTAGGKTSQPSVQGDAEDIASVWENALRAAQEEIKAVRACAVQAEADKERMLIAHKVAEEEAALLRERVRRIGDEADGCLRVMQVKILLDIVPV